MSPLFGQADGMSFRIVTCTPHLQSPERIAPHAASSACHVAANAGRPARAAVLSTARAIHGGGTAHIHRLSAGGARFRGAGADAVPTGECAAARPGPLSRRRAGAR